MMSSERCTGGWDHLPIWPVEVTYMPIIVVSKSGSGDLHCILSHPGKIWGLVHVCGNPEWWSGPENIKGHASKQSRSHEYVKFTYIRCKRGSGYIPHSSFLNSIALAPTIFYSLSPCLQPRKGISHLLGMVTMYHNSSCMLLLLAIIPWLIILFIYGIWPLQLLFSGNCVTPLPFGD